VTLRASGVVQVDVALTETPAPPPAPEPPAPVVAPQPPRPVGEFSTTDVPSFVERNFIGRNEPAKVTPLGCTGYATSRLIQLRDPLEGEVHGDADESVYVVAGELALGVEGRGERVLAAGSFATLPRGTRYSLTRRGRNPPILVSVLSGPPCEGAR
jgi:mannose-6-phosphate isomerase-like protein (cupin superfamily)